MRCCTVSTGVAEILIFHLIFHLICSRLLESGRLGERLGERSGIGYSLATAPLAVLGKLPEALRLEDGLATVVRQLAERLEREAAGKQADRLLTAAYVLTGLRLKAPEKARHLFQGVSVAIRESVTYQAILEEGREEGHVEGLHRTILRQGRIRFGEVDEAIRQQIEAIRNIDRARRPDRAAGDRIELGRIDGVMHLICSDSLTPNGESGLLCSKWDLTDSVRRTRTSVVQRDNRVTARRTAQPSHSVWC
jgi:hypothetical protein